MKAVTRPVIAGPLHRVDCGTYSVLWQGEKPEAPAPDSFGVTGLDFLIDGQTFAFKPSGTLNFSDWNFNIVSPDCAHVVLQEDRFGPLHVATVGNLKQQLAREKEMPAIEFPHEGASAAVISDVKWTSNTEIEFFASCCGGVEVFRFDLSKNAKAERVFFAASAPRGIKRVVLPMVSGYEIIK